MKTWLITLLVMVVSASALGCGGGAATEGSADTGGGSSGTSTTSSTDGTGGSGGSTQSGSSITVSMTDQHQTPAPNVPVVVNDAAGAVVLVTQTGPDGTVPVTVPPGGAVSRFTSQGLSFDVLSVVEPPDNAIVRLTIWTSDPEPPPPPATTTFHVTFTQVPQGVKEIDVYSCGQSGYAFGPSFTATVDNTYCTDHAASSFIAVARGAQYEPLAWGTAIDQPNNPGGAVDVQIGLAHTDFDAVAATTTDIPPGATFANVDVYAALSATSPLQFRAYVSKSPPSSTLDGQLLFPHGIFKSYQVSETVELDYGSTESTLSRKRVYAKVPSSTSLGVLSMALVAVNPLDVSDPMHPQATWSVSTGSRGDYVSTTIRWYGGTASMSYSAILPPNHMTSFRIPDIPPELGSFAPTTTSTFDRTYVGYNDDERISGYEQTYFFNAVPPMDGLGIVTSSGSNEASSP